MNGGGGSTPNSTPTIPTLPDKDRITRCADTAIRNFPRWRSASILDLM